MDLLPLSLLCLLKPFRHVGCAGSSTPSTEYLWHSAPLGGAEVWNRRSASRHQLMAQDDLVLSHGPVCPSPFASALDEVCASWSRSRSGCCSLSVTAREREGNPIGGVQLGKMDLIIVRLQR